MSHVESVECQLLFSDSIGYSVCLTVSTPVAIKVEKKNKPPTKNLLQSLHTECCCEAGIRHYFLMLTFGIMLAADSSLEYLGSKNTNSPNILTFSAFCF